MSSAVQEYKSTRVPTARVAMWWFLASEVAIFGGLIVCYVLFRVLHTDWADRA